MTAMIRAAGALAMTAIAALPACAQTLDRRVSGAPDGNVTFHFAARTGVCGDGRSYVRADNDMWSGTYGDMSTSGQCRWMTSYRPTSAALQEKRTSSRPGVLASESPSITM